ncbi:MAG: thioredoxin family protein [Candidatus Delongbacteria bacterium]|nr:thioredoxin family protein [Candidatus Delongbacteria bacterium]MDD4204652.1 thioredoxin family protein [Candidatus Delongbacteria bacterium]
MMEIKILGTGCPKCINLEKAARTAAESFDFEINIGKVTAIDEIMDYGVMITPALVIDEKVVSAGKVHSVEQIKEIIVKNKA